MKSWTGGQRRTRGGEAPAADSSKYAVAVFEEEEERSRFAAARLTFEHLARACVHTHGELLGGAGVVVVDCGENS